MIRFRQGYYKISRITKSENSKSSPRLELNLRCKGPPVTSSIITQLSSYNRAATNPTCVPYLHYRRPTQFCRKLGSQWSYGGPCRWCWTPSIPGRPHGFEASALSVGCSFLRLQPETPSLIVNRAQNSTFTVMAVISRVGINCVTDWSIDSYCISA